MQDILDLLNRYLALGFCLHGSQKRIALLEPRQARCNGGRPANCQNAVYASRDDVRIPCVMAMLLPTDLQDSHCSYHVISSGKMTVTGRNTTLKPGYVHVLPSRTFHEVEEEFVSFEPVRPVGVIRVTPEIIRLLPDIEVGIPY